MRQARPPYQLKPSKREFRHNGMADDASHPPYSHPVGLWADTAAVEPSRQRIYRSSVSLALYVPSALTPTPCLTAVSSRREDKPANVLNIHCLEELLLTLKQLELSDTLVVCYYWKFNCYACKSVAPKVHVPPRGPARWHVGGALAIRRTPGHQRAQNRRSNRGCRCGLTMSVRTTPHFQL